MNGEISRKMLLIICVAVAAIAFWSGSEYATWRNAKIGINDYIHQREESETVIEKEVKEIEDEILFVHIAGAVELPGVYRMRAGERLSDVIALAHASEDAALDMALNLAEKLMDGQKIYVPSNDELKQAGKTTASDIGPAIPPAYNYGSYIQSASESAGSRVNINTASQKELETLPGIGEVKAKAIIDYRTTKTPFSQPEDIMKVSGIGSATYEKLKDLITVSR